MIAQELSEAQNPATFASLFTSPHLIASDLMVPYLRVAARQDVMRVSDHCHTRCLVITFKHYLPDVRAVADRVEARHRVVRSGFRIVFRKKFLSGSRTLIVLLNLEHSRHSTTMNYEQRGTAKST